MANKKTHQVAFLSIQPWEADYFKKKLPGQKLFFTESDSPSPAFVKKAKASTILSVFVSSVVDMKIVNSFPNLGYIATRSTGYDHLDLKELGKKKIQASNVPDYGQNTVAEQAFGLLLSLTRKIHLSHVRTKKNNFSRDNLQGVDVKGKVLGIIGAGKIGQHMIKMAQGFGAEVIAYDAFPRPKLAKELGFKYVTLTQLLKNSDFISLHAPYLPSTRHILNRQNLKHVKSGCILINTARGELIETSALWQVIRSGRISAAGLDVLEEEELLFSKTTKGLSKRSKRLMALNKKIIHHPAVLFTPHNAFNTKGALTRILDTTVENIQTFIKKKPQNIVT
ncbi:MAG: NAD(P)-dependent oxidoreductase [bacterium]